jgi:hypothetical protein
MTMYVCVCGGLVLPFAGGEEWKGVLNVTCPCCDREVRPSIGGMTGTQTEETYRRPEPRPCLDLSCSRPEKEGSPLTVQAWDGGCQASQPSRVGMSLWLH